MCLTNAFILMTFTLWTLPETLETRALCKDVTISHGELRETLRLTLF